MPGHMHLVQMLMHTPITHAAMTWTMDDDRQLAGLTDFAYWQDIARTVERGCFDGIFFADTPAASDQYEGEPRVPVTYGMVWPTHDPLPVIAAMASVTKHLGFGLTLSLQGTAPFMAVRRLSTIDALSGGRIGWNVVTGHMRSEHRALGDELLEHDERYERGEEYMEVCYKLWDSVPAKAILRDKATGRFADYSQVNMVRHEGKYFRCQAISPCLPSPQGRPVIFQAGSSGRGAQFAVKHAEVIFSIQPHVAAMQKLVAQYRAEEARQERKAPIGILFGVQIILGSTEEEAQARLQRLRDQVPLEVGLARLSAPVGVDMSQFDPDKPIGELETQASQGMMAALVGQGGAGLTLRELGQRIGVSSGLMQVVGTPESVATQLETIWRESGGAGFILSPTFSPSSIHDFVDQVIPILQQRGVARTQYPGTTFRDTLTA